MQGQLLIAHPLLHDGFFNRSVVYLTNHGYDGAVGFSLNFETQFMLRDVRPQIKNGNFPIYEGGPVAKDQLFFLHTLGHDLEDAYHVKDNIYLGGNFEELLYKIEHNKIRSYEVKFFAGYSGWEPGQLEAEIKESHWLVNESPDSSFFNIGTENLWGSQLSQIKSSYGIFAEFGSDPIMN